MWMWIGRRGIRQKHADGEQEMYSARVSAESASRRGKSRSCRLNSRGKITQSGTCSANQDPRTRRPLRHWPVPRKDAARMPRGGMVQSASPVPMHPLRVLKLKGRRARSAQDACKLSDSDGQPLELATIRGTHLSEGRSLGRHVRLYRSHGRKRHAATSTTNRSLDRALTHGAPCDPEAERMRLSV